MDQKVDVAVLGAGLVGSAMAVALARHGLSVALVDRMVAEVRGNPDFDGRAYAVAPGSANLLRVLGIWDTVAPEARAVERIEVTDRCGGPVPAGHLHFDPAETGQAALGWIVEDRRLRGALIAAVAEAGVRQITPADVTGIRRGDGGAVLDLAGLDGGGLPPAETNPTRKDRTGSDRAAGAPITAGVVIACDGRRSALARAAGIPYLAWSYGQTGMVSAIAHEADHGGTAHQSFFPGGPFAVLPLTGRRSAIVWSDRTETADTITRASDEAYLAHLAARIGGRLGALTLEGRRWAYPLGLALAQRFAAPRLAVAGDAAHGVHPIAGQGLNMGFRDVAALTEVLVEAARRGEDIGGIDVLTRYERWRRFDASAMALGIDGLTRLFSTPFSPAQALRNIGLAAVARLGPARRGFMETASGLAGDVPRMLAGHPV